MAKSENKSFVPNLVQSGNCVFEDLTIRGSLTLSGDKKLVLNNKNGKNLILKCNDFGNLATDLTGDITGNVTGNLTGNVTGGEIYGTNINGTVGTGRTIEGIQTGSIVAPGMALQTVQDISSTQTVINVARSYTEHQTVTLETTRAGSSFLINGYTHAYFNSSAQSGGRANIGYSVTIDSTTTNLAGADSGGTDCWGNPAYPGSTMTRPFLWEPTTSYPAGTVMTFRMLAASYDIYTSGGTTYVLTLNYTGYGHKSVIQVTEIAGMLASP